MTDVHRIRIALPAHLRNLAGVEREVVVDVSCEGDPTVTDLLDALEERHPPLLGTVRDHATGRRRDYIRYFACGRDVSFDPPHRTLPESVVSGEEPFRVVGAIAGGAPTDPWSEPGREEGDVERQPG